jgi:predicted ATPase/DNA-binding CsgD family transcriptional regulator
MTQHLPVSLTSLIGRDDHLARLESVLSQSPVRLVTITGPGGIGKTRLALELAHRLQPQFAAGSFWVSLASVQNPADVPAVIASALGIDIPTGGTALAALTDYFALRDALLVLDNFEQVSAAAPVLAELLQEGSGLRVLVTSRTVLNISGEHRVAIAPLAMPDAHVASHTAPEVAGFPAIRLFTERANAATGGFALTADNAAHVVTICRALDGLPLAIELAAARLRHLPLAAISARLEDRFGLLVDGPRDQPIRHQTLHEAIDWSYRLLASPAQALFRHMAALPAGCTLATAHMSGLAEHQTEFGTLELFSTLVDCSLIFPLPDPANEPRYGMLETIRQFGLGQLRACGEEEATYRALGSGFADNANQARKAIGSSEQKPWIDRLDAERGNVRAICEWAIRANQPMIVLGLRTILWLVWVQRGNLAEGRSLLLRALASSGPTDDGERANAVFDLGNLAFELNDFETAQRAYMECHDVWERVNDHDGIASALNGLGLLDRERGEYASALTRLHLARETWESLQDESCVAIALSNLGTVEMAAGNVGAAVAFFSQALVLRRRLDDVDGRAYATLRLGQAASLEAQLEKAQELLGECQELFLRIGDRSGEAEALYALAYNAWLAGDDHKALRIFHDALSLWHALAGTYGIAQSVEGIATIAAARGNALVAARLLGATSAYRGRVGAVLPWMERQLIEAAWSTIRNRVDASASDEARQAGALLTLDEAAIEALRLLQRQAEDVPLAVLEKLSSREREVFLLLSEYKTDREIAEKLFLSHRTVERHVGSILAKLELKNRREAAALGALRRAG